MRRALSITSAAAVVLATACSGLFEDAVQCANDGDCVKFDATCDLAHGVCVARTSDFEAGIPPAPPGPTPPNPPPPMDSGVDGDVNPACLLATKPTAPVGTAVDAGVGEITGAVTLDCTKDWVVDGRVFVRAGATLTIQPRTTIRVKKGVTAGLVIQPGATIMARGERDAPIVMTSNEAAPARGDWKGLTILGVAPGGGVGTINGDPELLYGGVNANDNSGTLAFVRIEYAAYGLALGGVGQKTTIDSVEARMLSDNCFTIAGGTAGAKHLVCQSPGDELFELSDGFTGKLQFLYGQNAAKGDEHHGFLTDASSATVSNVTLCGSSQIDQNYGLVVRDGSKLAMTNAIFTGWFGGVDTRNTVVPPVELRGAIAFGNAGNPAYAEDPATVDPNSPLFDDDNGFDEIGWFRTAARTNAETNPGIACTDPKAPKPYPAAAITTGARTIPADGFFDPAAYVGAFKDATDPWMTGAWVRFDDK